MSELDDEIAMAQSSEGVSLYEVGVVVLHYFSSIDDTAVCFFFRVTLCYSSGLIFLSKPSEPGARGRLLLELLWPSVQG